MLTPLYIKEATSFAFNNSSLKDEKIIANNLIGTSDINKCYLNNCLIEACGKNSVIKISDGKIVNSLLQTDGEFLLVDNVIENSELQAKSKLHIKHGVLKDSFIRLSSGVSLLLNGVESRSVDIDSMGEHLSGLSINGLLVDCVLRGLVISSGVVKAIIYSSVLRSCLFENTHLEDVIINKCTLQKVVFVNCNLRRVTFSHCNIVDSPLVLENCDVMGAHFLNMSKSNVNFINCYGAEKVCFSL